MANIDFSKTATGSVPTPPAGSITLYCNSADNVFYQKDESGFSLPVASASGFTGVTAFADLTDVNVVAPINYDHLMYNGGKVVNTQILYSGATDLSNIFATIGSSGGINGTIDRIPKFTATDTIGNSIIIDNGSKIGIGGSPAASILEVYGMIMSVSAGTASPVYDAVSLSIEGIGGTYAQLKAFNSLPLSIISEGVGIGNGVGVTTPVSELEVNGTITSKGITGTTVSATTFYSGTTDLSYLIGTGGGGGGSTAVYSRSFTLTNPTASADGPLWRCPSASTITAIHVLCVDGTNIIGNLWEFDSNGLNGATVGANITASAGTNADQYSFTNPGIANGNYIGWKTTSVAGAVTNVIITFEYSIP